MIPFFRFAAHNRVFAPLPLVVVTVLLSHASGVSYGQTNPSNTQNNTGSPSVVLKAAVAPLPAAEPANQPQDLEALPSTSQENILLTDEDLADVIISAEGEQEADGLALKEQVSPDGERKIEVRTKITRYRIKPTVSALQNPTPNQLNSGQVVSFEVFTFGGSTRAPSIDTPPTVPAN